MNDIEASWIAHTKGKYPRECATPHRMHEPVLNDETFIKLVNAYGPAHNCYVSVYSFNEWTRTQLKKKEILMYNNAIIDCIFIDLDCNILPYAHYEVKLLFLYFKHHNCDIRVYFSGNKGFAVYIDFPAVQLDKSLVKPVLRKYLESIQSTLSLKSIDRVCFDCISRISRVPNTINHTSGLYCIPLSNEQLWGSLSNIKTLAKTPSKIPITISECEQIPSILLSIEADLKAHKKDNALKLPPIECKPNTRKKPTGTVHPQSLCAGIVKIIGGVSDGSRDNSLCAIICALNLQTRKPKDEIFTIAKSWAATCSPAIEIQDSTLSTKIDHLVDSDYKPCTFALRTGNKICAKCPVAKR